MGVLQKAKPLPPLARTPSCMALLRFVLTAASVAALVAGCTSSDGSGSSSSSGDVDSGPTVSCEHDPRVDTYVANLSKASASGNLKVTLVSSDPAPPIRGTNTWKVKVMDGAGNPMPNATLTVAPFMPDHGHPSNVKPQVTGGADGTYDIGNVYFFMPGVWRVTITVGTDSVEFFFCVPG